MAKRTKLWPDAELGEPKRRYHETFSAADLVANEIAEAKRQLAAGELEFEELPPLGDSRRRGRQKS